jgi:hypothetical protein
MHIDAPPLHTNHSASHFAKVTASILSLMNLAQTPGGAGSSAGTF